MKNKRKEAHTMNDMTMEYVRKTKDDVAQMLHDCSSCLILFHINPDGDCSASAFALKSMLEEMGKDAFCLCAQPLPERLQFIMTNQDGVTADFIPEGKNFDLVLSVDTAAPSQLGALYEEYRGKIDLMIDHHKRGTVYADNYIVPEASSCGEVIFGIFSHIEEKYGVKMYFEILPRTMVTEEFKRRALDLYDNGAERFGLWDTYGRASCIGMWNTAGKIGHKDELRDMTFEEYSKPMKIRLLGNAEVSRYHPNWGG